MSKVIEKEKKNVSETFPHGYSTVKYGFHSRPESFQGLGLMEVPWVGGGSQNFHVLIGAQTVRLFSEPCSMGGRERGSRGR